MEIENRQTQNSQQRVDGQKEKIRRVSLIDNVEESNRHRTKSFRGEQTNKKKDTALEQQSGRSWVDFLRSSCRQNLSCDQPNNNNNYSELVNEYCSLFPQKKNNLDNFLSRFLICIQENTNILKRLATRVLREIEDSLE